MSNPVRVTLAAIAVGMLMCMLTLFFLDRNVSYASERVKVECSSIYAFGASDSQLRWGSSGDSQYAVLHGEDAIE